MKSGQVWVKNGVLQEGKVEEFLLQAKKIYETEIAGVTEEKCVEMLNCVQIYEGKEIKDWTKGTYFKDRLYCKNEGILVGAIRERHGIGEIASYFRIQNEMTVQKMPGQEDSSLLPAVQAGISSRTRDRELAESFLKTMLGEKAQRYSTMEGIAVNRVAFNTMIEDLSAGHWSYGIKNDEGEFTWFEGPTQEGMTLFTEIIQAGKCSQPLDQQILNVVVKYGGKILENQISLEEGMQEIHRNIFVYLAE